MGRSIAAELFTSAETLNYQRCVFAESVVLRPADLIT